MVPVKNVALPHNFHTCTPLFVVGCSWFVFNVDERPIFSWLHVYHLIAALAVGCSWFVFNVVSPRISSTRALPRFDGCPRWKSHTSFTSSGRTLWLASGAVTRNLCWPRLLTSSFFHKWYTLGITWQYDEVTIILRNPYGIIHICFWIITILSHFLGEILTQ